jgi:4-hydroxybenzoate polyprenyltransferase
MTLLALYLVGQIMRLGTWYHAGLIAGGIFFLHHLWLIRHRERQACLQAFLNNNYFGMCIFLGIALDYQFAP